MNDDKHIAALIAAKADPVLISKFQRFPPAPKAVEVAPEPVIEEAKKEKKIRKKGA